MPLLLDTAQSGAAVELRGANCMTIGLVNNMPDAACEATERQFLDLIRGATSNAMVHLKLFSIADVPRADHVRREFAARYRDISELWDTRLDGLIVTGTEPRSANLEDEPYWATLAKLVDWARQNTVSAVWSCLAAHAAVLHADGIARRPLQEKKFGVFDCEIVSAHPLTTGMKPRLRVPHSRYNDVPERALAAGGYRLLTRSAAAGADAFVREEQGGSLFVFFQGHPEYETDTLAREYRRDVGCFLRGQRESYPAAPGGYFNDAATTLVNDFRARAVGDRRASLMADFPFAALEPALENTWRRSAIDVYESWIVYLKDRTVERRTAMVPGAALLSRCAADRRPAAGRRSSVHRIGVEPSDPSARRGLRRPACACRASGHARRGRASGIRLARQRRRGASLTSGQGIRKQPAKAWILPMKVRNSLKSLRRRHRDNRIVRRKGRVYVINKTQRRFKARQG